MLDRRNGVPATGSGCGPCGNAEGLGRHQREACSATASGGAPGPEHVGGTEEPDCRKSCKESATDDQGAPTGTGPPAA